MSTSNLPMIIPSKRAWNNGRIIGQKRPLLPKHVWAIRVRLEIAGAVRDLALFNLAVDSKLRGCDLVKLKVADVFASGAIKERVSILQSKTHIALGLGLAACQKGLSVGFMTASALVHELLEARDEKRLLRLQKQLSKYSLLIIDELGYVPLSPTGAELLFEVFSQRYERGSTIVTSNLPFDEWTGTFGSERLTGALLDRLTHHVHILEMNGDSYRLKQSITPQNA